MREERIYGEMLEEALEGEKDGERKIERNTDFRFSHVFAQ